MSNLKSDPSLQSVGGWESKNKDKWEEANIKRTDLEKYWQQILGAKITTHHKPKETIIPEDPEDTITSSGGPRPNSEDHQAPTEEEKEDLSSNNKRKNADKASITSTFNTLNPISWPH